MTPSNDRLKKIALASLAIGFACQSSAVMLSNCGIVVCAVLLLVIVLRVVWFWTSRW
jgi:hypothetical protein